MSIYELVGTTEKQSFSSSEKQQANLSSGALDLLQSAGNTLTEKAKEAAGAALLYLMACEMTLVTRTATLPKEADALLKDLGCTGITIDGKHVTMNLRDKKYKTFDGCPQLYFEKKVSADITNDGNRIELKNIKGLMVNPGDYVPWANVKSATLEKTDDGCIATVTGGRLGVNHTEKIKLPKETFDQLKKVLKANGF